MRVRICRAPAGMTLGQVVCGEMKWVLVSNYMVDFRWLLSSCPDLMDAKEIMLVHGEKAPELWVPCFPLQKYLQMILPQDSLILTRQLPK